MHSVITFLSSFSFAQMFLCALILLPHHSKNPSIKLYIILMLCSCCYLLSSVFPASAQYPIIKWLALLGGNALPGVFWLVGLSVFSDHITLKRWQYGLASLTLVIPLIVEFVKFALSIAPDESNTTFALIKYSSMLLEVSLILHTLIIALKHWRSDLVQERRYVRGGVITFASLYILVVIFANQLFDLQWLLLDVLMMSFMALLVTGLNYSLFKLRESSLFVNVIYQQSVTATDIKSIKELEKIYQAMDEEKLYRQEGLTISSFAKHLAMHEYKLRKLINGELNYRNFNDFLNAYRIKEVTENLVAPLSQNTPVLTIALDSGFRSLSSFNKAFKSAHGVTPTAYRKKRL